MIFNVLIIIRIFDSPTLTKYMEVLCKYVSPKIELKLQRPPTELRIRWGMSIQPQAVVLFDRPATLNTFAFPLHDVHQKIVQATTSHEDLLTLFDVAIMQSVM
jgi:hypothetical protein